MTLRPSRLALRPILLLTLGLTLPALGFSQVVIREKIVIHPAPQVRPLAEGETHDSLRFVFEWSPSHITGRMFVTGLDWDYQIVVDTFLTDTGGVLQVAVQPVDGEYTFNLQINQGELFPGEQEDLSLSVYRNEALLYRDTDFSYTYCNVFCVWIPQSYLFFGDPLNRFTVRVDPDPVFYGETGAVTVIARDADGNEIELDGSKRLSFMTAPEGLVSFITPTGDTVGWELSGVSYADARAGRVKLLPNGLIPDIPPVPFRMRAELASDPSKYGETELSVAIGCIEADFTSPVVSAGDTVGVGFHYRRSDGMPGSFLPDQQYRVSIPEEMGTLHASDGQSGSLLEAAYAPVQYIAPDSLSVDTLIVPFEIAPLLGFGGGAASAQARAQLSPSSAREARLAVLSEQQLACVPPTLVVTRGTGIDHFVVTAVPDTIRHSEESVIRVQAKSREDKDVTPPQDAKVNIVLKADEPLGVLAYGGAVGNAMPDVPYADAKSGKVVFAATLENPIGKKPQPVQIGVTLVGKETVEGIDTVVVKCKRKVERYTQGGQDWSSDKYDHSDATVGGIGCALSSMAMVMTSYGDAVNPRQLNEWMKDRTPVHGGYYGLSVNWNAMALHGNKINFPSYVRKSMWTEGSKDVLDTTKSTSVAVLDEPLSKCNLAIVQVYNEKTGNQHWVVVTGKEGSRYTIVDPGGRNESYLDAYGRFWSYLTISPK
jgi:hypothetical protein